MILTRQSVKTSLFTHVFPQEFAVSNSHLPVFSVQVFRNPRAVQFLLQAIQMENTYCTDYLTIFTNFWLKTAILNLDQKLSKLHVVF